MMPIDRRRFLAMTAAAGAIGPASARAPIAATVTTTLGRVRGRAAGGMIVFTGIPYGDADRFAPPRPAQPWRDVLDATGLAGVAPQPRGQTTFAGRQTEDCLQLNVWAPATPGPYPVMVYIHGGSNETGWSGDPVIAGDRFAAHGVVCVTFNYRLGAFGFVELGELLGPAFAGSANNAMRDLILALRWVRANIAAFGGDPARVCLAGESAGGKNVGTLMGAPAADGLYASAAIFSGGAQTAATPADARAFAASLAEHLGGADKLRSASVAAILAAQQAAKADWPRNFPFRPMVDGHLLPAAPLSRIKKGDAPGVPLLIGSNADESRLFVSAAVAGAALSERYVANETMTRMDEIDNIYTRLFPALSTAERHWRLLTAEEYGMPCLRIAAAHAGRGADVFRYRLTYPAPGGPLAGSTPHALDVPLSFDHLGGGGIAAFFGLSPKDWPVAEQFHAVVTGFATAARPVAAGLPAWPRYKLGQRLTMVIGLTATVAADPDGVERRAWDE